MCPGTRKHNDVSGKIVKVVGAIQFPVYQQHLLISLDN